VPSFTVTPGSSYAVVVGAGGAGAKPGAGLSGAPGGYVGTIKPCMHSVTCALPWTPLVQLGGWRCCSVS
jgi:hypothetical protein